METDNFEYEELYKLLDDRNVIRNRSDRKCCDNPDMNYIDECLTCTNCGICNGTTYINSGCYEYICNMKRNNRYNRLNYYVNRLQSKYNIVMPYNIKCLFLKDLKTIITLYQKNVRKCVPYDIIAYYIFHKSPIYKQYKDFNFTLTKVQLKNLETITKLVDQSFYDSARLAFPT